MWIILNEDYTRCINFDKVYSLQIISDWSRKYRVEAYFSNEEREHPTTLATFDSEDQAIKCVKSIYSALYLGQSDFKINNNK